MSKVECPICHGTRHVLVDGVYKRCSCLKSLKATRVMEQAGFPLPLVNIKSTSFKLTTESRKILGQEILKRTKEWSTASMFIYSATSEKEKAAAIITRYSASLFPEVETALFIRLEELTEQFFDKDLERPTVKPETADILTLVIGTEITNNAHRNILYNLLYHRLLNDRLTIICSSLSKDQLRATYLDKAAEIISENFMFFEC